MAATASSDVRTGRRPPADLHLRQRDERVDSLKAVAGKLAHDFNNFLAPNYGYITLLKDEVAPGSTQAVYIGAMESSALKTERYVASVLAGMRPQRQFAPRDLELHAILQEFVEKWRAETPAEADVSISSHLERCVFRGDEKQWRMVFEQLFSNARYALAMGGRLEITLERKLLPGTEVERLGLPTNDVFRVQVRDSGFGMKPEIAHHAFEPFFTTRTQVKAAGLGLTIVHGITLFHGGQVELASAEDQGTTVTLWLPATLRERPEGLESNPTSKPFAMRKKALLIADDPLIKEVLRGWLASHELDIDNASNEKEARRFLQRAGDLGALVVCEADLKSGRAEDLYESIRDVHSPARWVFLTGKRTPEFAAGHRPQDLLVMKKPVSHTAFSEVVRSYTCR